MEQIKQQIMLALGALGINDEQKEKIASQLLNNISLRLSMEVFDKLPEEDRQELLVLAKEKDQNKIANFLNGKIADLPEITKKIVLEEVEALKKAE